MSESTFQLGRSRPVARLQRGVPLAAMRLPAHHLVTHSVVVGMTGSGKTGLVMVTVEEALRAKVPVVMIDVKGDLPNLLLAFPDFEAASVRPYVSAVTRPGDDRDSTTVARELAEARRVGLTDAGIGQGELRAFRDTVSIRVLTPGSNVGEPLHVFSALERASSRWAADPESARASLGHAVSLVLRVLGHDADPARSKEHVLLSVLAERRLAAGEAADLPTLIRDLLDPPLDSVGELDLEDYLAKRERKALAAALNSLLASPTFARWREGASLDAGEWLAPRDGRTSATIVSVAHLDDAERELVLGLVLEELLSHVRSMPGSQSLRALVVFDEVYGFLPPHPANPATKRPIVTLMKQARAFGVGVLLATQNPMDLDYRALSNAGLWCIGRLQTDADRQRVVEGLAGSSAGLRSGESADELASTVKVLRPRWFLVRDAHVESGLSLLYPRQTMAFLRGPMTRAEMWMARGVRGGLGTDGRAGEGRTGEASAVAALSGAAHDVFGRLGAQNAMRESVELVRRG